MTFGTGTAQGLDELIERTGARRVLVVSTGSALARTGFGHWPDLPGRRVFPDFRPNPDLEDVLVGCALRDAWGPDLVVGLGGGSAMDVAKLVRALPSDRDAALACLTGGGPLPADLAELLLVPTTSGTGSEVTQFATVFDGERKYSFDHPLAAATHSVVDPGLTETCPADVLSSCAADSLCHAVESLWARRSVPRSRFDALEALHGLAAPLAGGLKDTSLPVREELARCSLAAGRAINVTRTTAAHAFAYRLTRRYGVPHGVACLLNLQWVYAYNLERVGSHCADDRGVVHVRTQLEAVAQVWGLEPRGVPERLGRLLTDLGWSPRLSDYGVPAGDLRDYVEAGLGATARADNNPVHLDSAPVLRALREIH
ncbi:phosphonoacetaldehyde reductase [Streptomyces parvus]|uniref:phosphonoacetaldehyde reductase n=1 Tax=Streptomyces parvus TaxID=66428 RepID=UPI003641C4C8